MADMKALPVFAFTEERVQIEQLRAFLNERGASLDLEGPPEIEANLLELVSGIGVVGDLESDKEVEMVLSSVSSLMVVLSSEQAIDVVDEFCKQVSSEKYQGIGWPSNAGAAVRILSNLFHAFNKHPRVQHSVFVALVVLCGRARLIGDLDTSTEQLNEYFKKWSLQTEQKRSLLRLIHGALINDGRSDQAAKTMTALLGTYTDSDAASAIEDGRECVRTAIVDPKSFSFDHLLRLPAVKLLQKTDSTMYNVLILFSQGTLSDYRKFVKEHPNFVREKLRVDEAVLVKKIRLLTLMSMAEKNSTILLSDLSKELDISDDELEEFIIEAIQVNAITGKINGVRRELNVSSLQPRCFGREQWELLQKRLVKLINDLAECHENIKLIQFEKV